MDERQQEFRVGIILPSAAGIHPETAVRMSGIRIGQVESTQLVAEGRGVMVQVLIDADYTFRNDSTAQVTRSLLGDGSIEILPGASGNPIVAGDRIAGRSSSDPAEIVARVERQLSSTLTSFERTGQEWGKLAGNLNRVLEISGQDGVNTMERSAVALQQFTKTMKTAEETLAAAGTLISDPRYQQQLQATMTALPELLNETRGTLHTVNQVVGHLNTTVANINTATTPLAQQSQSMVSRLNRSLANIETITGEVAVVSQLMNQNDGTIKKLLTEPQIYRNLNSTSASLAVLLENLKPVVADLQVVSDKVARHPELLGVRGIVRGSRGTKETGVIPAGFEN
jgi:phospholipid/cholesterol/gamma-HCH transport system substrate-binding protein